MVDTSFRMSSAGAVTATTVGTTVTSGAASDTKNTTYAELTSATTIAANGVELFISKASLPDNFLIDIAIGAASAEQVIIPNIGWSQARSANSTSSIYFPIRIPVGVRLSATCQDTAGANTIQVSARLHSSTRLGGLRRVVSYGASGSTGTTIDPGGSANTLGSWVQLTAATTAPHCGLIFAWLSNVNSAMTAANWMVNVAIGAGGAEQTIIPNIMISAESTYDGFTQMYSPFIPICIPLGSRIAMQAQCTTTDATDRLLRTIIYGVG